MANIIAAWGVLSISIWDIAEFDNIDRIIYGTVGDIKASVFSIDISCQGISNAVKTVKLWINIGKVLAAEGPELMIFFGFDLLFMIASTLIFGIAAIVFFIKSIASLKKNQEKSVRNSKMSIKSAAIVYACQILCVLIFNAYFSLAAPYPLTALRLTFPYATAIFLLICIAMLKLPQLAGAAASNNTAVAHTNSSVPNVVDWYCSKCGSGNRIDHMFCIYCGGSNFGQDYMVTDLNGFWEMLK